MKKILTLTPIIAVALAANMALAADYSQYTTEELNSMRGTLRNATQQERDTFRSEWQNRIQNMTQEERQKYMAKPQNAGQGQGGMMQQRGYGMRKGSGMRG